MVYHDGPFLSQSTKTVPLCVGCLHHEFGAVEGARCKCPADWQDVEFLATGNLNKAAKAVDARRNEDMCSTGARHYECKIRALTP